MSIANVTDALETLPEGYAAIPISADQMSAPLKLCAVVRLQADPVAGHLVVLRDTVDAHVLLGCVTDAAGQIHRYVELWIQNIQGLCGGVSACREALSNAVLDDRWRRQVAGLSQLDGEGLINTGWEEQHPLPVFLDLSRREPVHPLDADSGTPWKLCQDDALLKRKNLPPYSTSLHRYLYSPARGEGSLFVPVTPDAPAGEFTKSLAELTGPGDIVAMNPCGGLLMVRSHCPISLEPYADMLSGGKWEGVFHGRSILDLGGAEGALKDDGHNQPSEGRLFLGPHGRWGRLVETFHLKLRLLADAANLVATMVKSHQRPLLNLSADSFRVEMDEPSTGLPFLWTARVRLVDPGDAVTLPIRASDAQYFLRAGTAGTSVYQPASVGLTLRGRGAVRIRQVLPDAGGATILEGTFSSHERLEPGKNDLVWIRVSLGSGRVDLYGRLEAQTALAGGEWRFRTVSLRLGEAQAADLRAAQGVPIPDVPFEVIPLLSTPCDLYALGVLAVRLLLVDGQTTLPVALDETLSLARQLATDFDAAVTLPIRIRTIFESDKRWAQSLGPHRLAKDGITPEEAMDLIPPELWWDTLAMVVRMFPGVGRDSQCRDFGDAPAGGIHRIFDTVQKDLDCLLLRTRSLIVIDWRFNREIHSVIRGYLMGLADKSSRESSSWSNVARPFGRGTHAPTGMLRGRRTTERKTSCDGSQVRC